MKLLPILFLLACLAAPALAGGVDGTLPNPPVPGIRTSHAPVIDGVPDDPCWADAPVIGGFTHDTLPASVTTDVRVLYDDQAMYFAFVCHVPNVGTIRAQQRKRNGGLDNDDNVAVGIDPRYDKRDAYWFRVNPLGTQSDDIPGGSASKVQWRGDWRAAARITADGWTAEMAIPYGILRYPRGQRTFGLMFERNVPNLLETSNWPTKTFYYVHDNEARWADVEAPRVQRKPLIMPYVLGGSGTIESNAGVDVKYTSENDATSLLTIRPDFATIEDEVQTIDFSYGPKYVDDRRPFFTEGGDHFGSDYGFYSPNIGQVDVGAKTFGKSGPFSFAAMGTTHRDDQSDVVANVGYDPSQLFGVNAAVVEQDPSPGLGLGGRNAVFKIGANTWKPLAVNGMGWWGELYKSVTDGPGGDGSAMQFGVNRFGADGVFEWHASYHQISPGYRANLAFLDEVNLRSVGTTIGEGWRAKKGPIRRWAVRTHFQAAEHWSGGFWHDGVSPSAEVAFRNNTRLDLGADLLNRKLNVDAPDSPFAVTVHDRIANASFAWRDSDLYRRGSVFVRSGRQAGGPYTFADVSQGFKLSDKLSASLDFSALRLNGIDVLDPQTFHSSSPDFSPDYIRTNIDRAILSAVYELNDERSVAARFIAGRETDNNEPTTLRNAYIAYRQEVRKGADIFVLIGDPNVNDVKTQAAIKYVVTY